MHQQEQPCEAQDTLETQFTFSQLSGPSSLPVLLTCPYITRNAIPLKKENHFALN